MRLLHPDRADLARLQDEFRQRGVQVVFVSHGDAKANRKLAEKHRLKLPILLIGKDADVPEAFRSTGTPVAYLLDAEGRVAKPLAVGYVQVQTLAEEAANGKGPKTRFRLPGEKPLSASKLERNGLKAGTPAPPFRLPEIIHGRNIALEDFRGRPVLLVFSDPHCGPCEQLAELARLHQERGDDLSLILVGRGERDENRRKAREHGFEFPVVIQKGWELSKQYGIFATPVAYLIGADGVIARDVARGGKRSWNSPRDLGR